MNNTCVASIIAALTLALTACSGATADEIGSEGQELSVSRVTGGDDTAQLDCASDEGGFICSGNGWVVWCDYESTTCGGGTVDEVDVPRNMRRLAASGSTDEEMLECTGDSSGFICSTDSWVVWCDVESQKCGGGRID